MAILVSNPSTVQFTGAPTEPQDPAAMPLDAGFTEELAHAMQLPAQLTDGANSAPKPLLQGAHAKLNDLQILPPDVLLNAVGEANFAFSNQGVQASEEAAFAQDDSGLLAETPLPNALEATQAAEMAAAAMAAQISIQVPVAAAPVHQMQAPDAVVAVGAVGHVGDAGDVVDVGDVGAGLAADAQLGAPTTLSSVGPQIKQVALNPSGITDSLGEASELLKSANNAFNQNLNQLVEVAQVANQPLTDSLTPMAAANSVGGVEQNPTQTAQSSTLSIQIGLEQIQALPSSVSADQSNAISNKSLNASEPLLGQVNQAPLDSVQESSAIPVVKAGESGHLSVSSKATVLQATSTLDSQPSSSDRAKSDVEKPIDPNTSLTNQSSVTQPSYQGIASLENNKTGLVGQEKSAVNATGIDQLTGVPMGSSIRIAGDASLQNSKPETKEEASFKFDAKLGGPLLEEGFARNTNFSKPVSFGGDEATPVSGSVAANMGVSEAPPAQQGQVLLGEPAVLQTATTSGIISAVKQAAPEVANSKKTNGSANNFEDQVNPSNAPLKDNGTDARGGQVSVINSRSADTESLNELIATNANVQQVVEQNVKASATQVESQQSVAKSFSEVSSTFVSTLVGGPQRPVTTVMDWVSLKPQEPPRPVMPHELRLDAGAVQVEIQRMVSQGGGHVVMELTPPDQSKFTIELKLDDKGGAFLRVEGVSDSTKTRLEQSAPQLQEQFQEMGLNLQLDMRQNKDSSSSGTANWTPNEPGFDNAKPQEALVQTTRVVGAERARNNNGGQVYLYA